MPELEKLESRLGHRFQRSALLTRALTHRSYGGVNNERLEFLGDAILDYVIASALYEQFPAASEGDLTRLRASLVRQATLAAVAREAGLGAFLLMGGGERKSGGFERESILSDALEAIIGAVFLDSDVETASECVLGLFERRLQGLTASDQVKDAKSRLQEYLQSVGEAVPEYVLLQVKGKSPNEEFEVECRSAQFSARAAGSAKWRAEQRAAELVLKALEP